MELDIHVGKRVLYKHNNQWCVGLLTEVHNTKLTNKGLYLSVIPVPVDSHNITHDAEINDLYLDAKVIEEDWRHSDTLMTKKEYCDFIESEDFDRARESAWVSDGEYYYYPISKFTRYWIEKQPFDYIIRAS